MSDALRTADGWAGERRRRWSTARIVATLALHALVLVALKLAIDRVQLPQRGAERSTLLVDVTLHLAPPPVRTPTPPLRTATPAHASPRETRAPAPPTAHANTLATTPEDTAHAIALPTPPRGEAPEVAAAPPPASAPSDLSFLNSAATRQAIRAVARGDTLSSHANALTHEEPGSELVAADGSHAGTTRNLPPPPPAELLAQNIAAAHKGDCMKGEYMGGGMGLLSAPFLLAAEAMGKCAHK